MKLVMSLLAISFAGSVCFAQAKCVEKEIPVVLKSNRNVHYQEKDEGRVVGKVRRMDCGKAVKAPVAKPPSASAPARPCPSNVQDCIKR